MKDEMSVRPPFKRRTLWLGFVAVLLPLAVMLALQYRWLVKLDHASEEAHQAALKNYLEAVSDKIRYTYSWQAEQVLDLPSYVFTEEVLEEKVPAYFEKKWPQGARQLFVVSFVGDQKGKILYYQHDCKSLAKPKWSDEVQAVWVAQSSWSAMAREGGKLETVDLVVDERDPRNRIVLYPVTDDRAQVVGVAGMILDEWHLRAEVLPEVIAAALPKFELGDDRFDPVVRVRDRRQQTIFSTDPDFAGDNELERPLAFVFTDWSLGLAGRHPTPGEWARSNFRLNVGLSAILAAVLLGGVVLALRTASREMKLSQMKSDFVSNVSHELRTPLASIRVFGEFLRLGRVESAGKAREYGEYIETESRRLTQLINNLLDFSRIESGRRSYRLEPAQLGELVGDTLRTFEVRLRQAGFRLTYKAPTEPLPEMRLDPAAIVHSFANLLDNAIKYSGEAKEIAVTLERRGDEAVISVRDWGVGIPRDEQEKIFDRFHRVSTGLLHDVKGSGLGLAIVRHVLDAHGGEVRVESRQGHGSTFSIVLPIDRLRVEAERPASGGLGLGREQPSGA